MNLSEKLRPKNLSEVIGNQHIVRALKNQLSTNSLSQTMLFTGIPGSGKTAFARIIASELSAEVIEIDCGSDGGIDKIREVIESVSLSSLFSGKKVFILDEAHALGKPAQSALLKTLEDDQPDVYFILLTTDPQKILKTIRTRCVEYQTNPAGNDEIGQAVKKVESIYKVWFENRKDLWAIVEQSGGSLRQVYALLEKLIGVADVDGRISTSMFHSIMGKSMEHVDENLPKAFLEEDLLRVINLVTEMKKDSSNNPTGTLIGVYNYLKAVFLKNPQKINDKGKSMLSDMADRVHTKDISWEVLEHLAWKYL